MILDSININRFVLNIYIDILDSLIIVSTITVVVVAVIYKEKFSHLILYGRKYTIFFSIIHGSWG